MKWTLGIDPGLRNTGWGMIEVLGTRLSFVACGSVHSVGALHLAARLRQRRSASDAGDLCRLGVDRQEVAGEPSLDQVQQQPVPEPARAARGARRGHADQPRTSGPQDGPAHLRARAPV